MTNSKKNITILGGGVSGITTGIMLQVLGYETEILTRERADSPSNPNDPTFASLYPSASVIPHSIYGSDILKIFDESQRLFKILLSERTPGISLNRHYEVFEYPKETPSYARKMKSFDRIDGKWKIDPDVPRLGSSGDIYGWVFDCFFADWPVYMPELFRWYKRLGGPIKIEEITNDKLNRLEGTIINCLGMGSRFLFDDHAPHIVVKGHLVKVAGAPKIKTDRGKTVSYNYNPVPEKYSDREGDGQDLYCYSREDGWILGGSRLEGTIGADGNWEGISPEEEGTEINGMEVPAPILEINAGIISESYGISLEDYPDREAVVGYRYLRDRDDGLRLERNSKSGKNIIHNYGHGGAGVTLSWGCALRIARWLSEEGGGTRLDPKVAEPLSSALLNAVRRIL